MALTPKKQRFIDEYPIDLNATQAAIRAGYSEKTAYSQGARLLKDVEIQQAISEAAGKLQQKVGLTQERLLKEVERLAFFDPRKLYNADGSLKPVTELDDDTAAALAGFEVSETGIDGEAVSFLKKVKWYDKNTAIDKGMRYFGMLKDKVEHTGKDGKDLMPVADTNEIARRVAFLLQAGAKKKSLNAR